MIAGRTSRSGRADGGAGTAADRARRRDLRAQRVLHAQARRRRPGARTPAVSARPRTAAADDEGGAGRRSGRESALGHRAHRAARALHALLPDLVDDRTAAALDRHQRELAVDARVLEGRLSRRARRRRAIACSSRFRSGRSSASGPASKPGCQMGLHCVPGGGMSSQHAARDDRIASARRSSAARRPTRCGWPRLPRTSGPLRPLAESTVRVLIVAGEPGGSIPADARADRAELGRARHRSSRADRSRAGQLRVLGGAGVSAPQRRASSSARCSIRRRARAVADGEPASWSSRTSAARPARSSATAPATSSCGGLTPCACGRTWARLEGGILARADDMVNIRGVNVYPAASSRSCAASPRSSSSGRPCRRTARCARCRLEIELGAAGGRRCSDCRARGASAARGAWADGAGARRRRPVRCRGSR